MNTVLIVEDEKMIRQGIKTMIQRSGVPVNVIIECNNGQMALEILQNQTVDVMFTDIRMPKMDGIELVRQIQNLEHKPIVVAVSGYDDFAYAVELMRLGVREYILKPVDRNKLKEVLEKLDSEINYNKGKNDELRNMFYQQLKFIMLNDISSKEAEFIFKQNNNLFINTSYVVCCIPKGECNDHQNNQYIFLSDVDNNDIYIVSEENKNFLLRNELKDFYTGISGLHYGLRELNDAYKEAVSARKVAFLTGRKSVEYIEERMGRYSIKSEQEDIQNEINKDSMQAIGQMIGTDKIKNAVKQIEMLKYDTVRGKYTVDSLKANIEILLDNIVKLYQNLLKIDEDIIVKFKNLLGYPDIESYFEDLTGWLININEEINTQFDDYKNKLKIQTAIKYIEENYDKDLNMAVVSNYISMNYSLFSYLFKQYTGNNFVNYLKDLRINEAKRLLKDTDLRVNEVSQKVGYDNEKHFMKIFKNTCGVSPSEYRKIMQLKNVDQN